MAKICCYVACRLREFATYVVIMRTPSHLNVHSWECLSVHPSICILFLDDNLSIPISGFSPNLVFALILWRSGLGLLMGKFRQILMVICRRHALFSFPDDNLSKFQGILSKLGTCIDVKVICLGLLMGKFCQRLTELSAHNMIGGVSICPRHAQFSFPDDNK